MAAMQTHWPVPAIRTTRVTDLADKPRHSSEPNNFPVHPDVHRILRLRSKPDGTGVRWYATVCDADGLRDITWWGASHDVTIQSGQLIRITQLARRADGVRVHSQADQCLSRTVTGLCEVHGVTPLWQVDPDVNLLETVPQSWLPSPRNETSSENTGVNWVERFRQLWIHLSRPMRAWFNAVFWHRPWRLHAFLSAPGSMKHHHARQHGLFIHSVDCAWRALGQVQDDALVNVDVLVLSALLHDVGKAGEYRWNDQTKQWHLSDRGALMGHRLTGVEWMATARGSLATCDAPGEYLAMAVYHAINASNAPDWVGLRAPRTPEAFYLASVDGLSGHCDLVQSHALVGRSRGRYHSAFRGGVYVFNGERVGWQ